MDIPHPTPDMRHPQKDMIPLGLVRAMAGLVIVVLALTTFAALSGREPSGQPAAAAVLQERMLILQGGGAQAVTVLKADGTLLVDLPHGGFITVVQNAMETQRRRHGVDLLLPVRVVAYANGRLAVEDPETGWSVETQSFGGDNAAVFRQLLNE